MDFFVPFLFPNLGNGFCPFPFPNSQMSFPLTPDQNWVQEKKPRKQPLMFDFLNNWMEAPSPLVQIMMFIQVIMK